MSCDYCNDRGPSRFGSTLFFTIFLNLWSKTKDSIYEELCGIVVTAFILWFMNWCIMSIKKFLGQERRVSRLALVSSINVLGSRVSGWRKEDYWGGCRSRREMDEKEKRKASDESMKDSDDDGACTVQDRSLRLVHSGPAFTRGRTDLHLRLLCIFNY